MVINDYNNENNDKQQDISEHGRPRIRGRHDDRLLQRGPDR